MELTQNMKVCALWKLVEYQNDKALKLAPKLTAAHVNPTQFQKMNVKLASQVRIITIT